MTRVIGIPRLWKHDVITHVLDCDVITHVFDCDVIFKHLSNADWLIISNLLSIAPSLPQFFSSNGRVFRRFATALKET